MAIWTINQGLWDYIQGSSGEEIYPEKIKFKETYKRFVMKMVGLILSFQLILALTLLEVQQNCKKWNGLSARNLFIKTNQQVKL